MINNKETWIQIKEEYLTGIKKEPDSCWICSFSDTFKALWEGYYEEIKEVAREFLSPDSIKKGWFIGDVILFRCFDLLVEDKQRTRLEFIDYMINKL